jgi:hypothetical protein
MPADTVPPPRRPPPLPPPDLDLMPPRGAVGDDFPPWFAGAMVGVTALLSVVLILRFWVWPP